MQASVIFSLGETNPAPPSTWRGTMAKALAATPLAAMKRRRETDTDGNLLLGAARFRGPRSNVFSGTRSGRLELFRGAVDMAAGRIPFFAVRPIAVLPSLRRVRFRLSDWSRFWNASKC
jgi:hypothetical protein